MVNEQGRRASLSEKLHWRSKQNLLAHYQRTRTWRAGLGLTFWLRHDECVGFFLYSGSWLVKSSGCRFCGTVVVFCNAFSGLDERLVGGNRKALVCGFMQWEVRCHDDVAHQHETAGDECGGGCSLPLFFTNVPIFAFGLPSRYRLLK